MSQATTTPATTPPTTAPPTTAPTTTAPTTRALRTTARTTGLFYLGLGVTGMLGFLLVRPRAFPASGPEATLAALLADEQLARVGLVLELGIVVTQALAALWFFRLFRQVDDFAAGAIAVFGLVNSVAILGSAASLATAVEVAASGAGRAEDAHLMVVLSENLWGVGAVFFGLWLVPMGWCVLRSRWMPRVLGWLLVVGGVGYVLSAVVGYLAPGAVAVVGLLTVPATLGEFAMIGYLLLWGVRRRRPGGGHVHVGG